MIKNFTIPDGEQPFYYSTTVENGVIVRHDGDPQYAVYKSGLRELRKRADRWHKWVAERYPAAYDSMGVLDTDILAENAKVNREFMDGERQ